MNEALASRLAGDAFIHQNDKGHSTLNHYVAHKGLGQWWGSVPSQRHSGFCPKYPAIIHARIPRLWVTERIGGKLVNLLGSLCVVF